MEAQANQAIDGDADYEVQNHAEVDAVALMTKGLGVLECGQDAGPSELSLRIEPAAEGRP